MTFPKANSMKIYYISSHSIYKTGSNANRILCILRGLSELGHKVILLHSIPIELPTNETRNKFSYRCISYKSFIKSYSITGRIHFAFLSTQCAYQCYREVKRSARIEKVVVLSLDSMFLNKLFLLLFYLNKNIISIKEVLEYPEHLIRPSNMLKKLYSKINYAIEFKIYNGYYAISTNLQKYLQKKVSKNKIVGLIPICVEKDRFLINKTQTHISPYIAYCGDMSNNKDGVDILIDAFDIIFQQFPSYHLLIIGSGEPNYYENIKCKAQSLSSGNNIVFTGLIHRDEIPRLIVNADILALARPSNKQAEGGLPTKLGEYLATGNPVVITDVSDIKLYLGKDKAAYIAEPDSSVTFADMLISVIENPDEAEQVGKRGQIVASEKFNYIKVAEQLTEFINKVIISYDKKR